MNLISQILTIVKNVTKLRALVNKAWIGPTLIKQLTSGFHRQLRENLQSSPVRFKLEFEAYGTRKYTHLAEILEILIVKKYFPEQYLRNMRKVLFFPVLAFVSSEINKQSKPTATCKLKRWFLFLLDYLQTISEHLNDAWNRAIKRKKCIYEIEK